MGLLCTFDDRTALFASVPGAFFVYRFHLLELIVLRAGSLETFRTTAVAQLFAVEGQMAVSATKFLLLLRQ